jgi:hypothetical protein
MRKDWLNGCKGVMIGIKNEIEFKKTMELGIVHVCSLELRS